MVVLVFFFFNWSIEQIASDISLSCLKLLSKEHISCKFLTIKVSYYLILKKILI